jgi:hypothetical protein
VPDTQILASGSAAAPESYTVPPAQEILVKAVSCTLDGTGASGDFYPMLSIIPPGGVGAIECPMLTSVAAGESAEVSWFPGGIETAAATPSTLPTFQGFTPEVFQGGVPLTDPAAFGAYWSQGVEDGLFSSSFRVTFGSDLGPGGGAQYRIQLMPELDSHFIYSASGLIGVGTAFDLSEFTSYPAWIDGDTNIWSLGDSGLNYFTPTYPFTVEEGDTLFDGTCQGVISFSPG